MAGHGGRRTAAPGKAIGRPKKTAAPPVRRDVAFEVLAILNAEEKKRAKKLAGASGEAQFVFKYLGDDNADKRLRWDVYRYMKECVDSKPMVKSEEKVIFDPTQPIRVVVEHIGQSGSRRS